MKDARNKPLQRLSDGLLPDFIRKRLDIVLIDDPPFEINGWSFIHMFSGLLLARMGYSMGETQSLHASWEFFQLRIGDNDFSLESFVDVAADTWFTTVGFLLGSMS